MRVIGYTRVSPSETAEEGVSLKVQASKIDLYCQLHNLDLVVVIMDPLQSGKSLKRPGITKALQLLKAGEADGIVVANLDRLTRKVSDMGRLIDDYFGPDRGKHLFSVADSIDTRTPSGRLVLNVLTSIAQWVRESIVEGTISALKYKKSRGERIGTVPFGSDLDELGPRNSDGRPINLVDNADELATLKRILALRDLGGSIGSIAAYLTAAGIPTKTGKLRWCRQSVARILDRHPQPRAT